MAAPKTLNPAARTHRSRIAALTRSRPADDPELLEARRSLEIEKLAEHIKTLVDAAPPLSEETKARLRTLLGGAA